jgi:hypothetical protein
MAWQHKAEKLMRIIALCIYKSDIWLFLQVNKNDFY